MKRYALSVTLALAGGLAYPAASWTAETRSPDRLVVDSLSATEVSVEGTDTRLEIVLLPDALEYRPVHPDLVDEGDETEEPADALDTPAETP
ncbi:MAG: hypothetical protein ABIO65_13415 [Nitrospiria bacterium]